MSQNKGIRNVKYLKKVIISSDVYAVCIEHALTNESQEIMGLLVGEIDQIECVTTIHACIILHRSDKRRDRVEISPEQLCNASIQAEKLCSILDRRVQIVGWYHSHPHITINPSVVDIRTQSTYQLMDPLFVGLIFSVFTYNKLMHDHRVEVICFQADPDEEKVDVPLIINNSPMKLCNLEAICNLPKILIEEEVESHNITNNDTKDPITKLHNEACKTLAVTHIVSKLSRPLCEALIERLNATKLRIKELQAIKNKLTR